MVLLAGFQALLARYSGQDDLAVGTPDRRPQPGGDRGADRVLRQHAGAARRPGGRPVVPRAARPGARDGAGRLRAPGRAVREAGRGAGAGAEPRARAAVPGDARAAERSRREPGDPGPAPAAGGRRGGRRRSSISRSASRSSDGGLAGTVEYATDLFDATTIDRLVGHFERLLAGGRGRRRSGRSSELPLLERGRAASAPASSGTTRAAAFPREAPASTSCSRRRRRGRRTAVAVELGDEQLTYAELDGGAPTAWPAACAARASARRCRSALLRRALAGPGGGAAGHPQGRRRLLPLDPGLPARSAWPSCSRTRGRRCC